MSRLSLVATVLKVAAATTIFFVADRAYQGLSSSVSVRSLSARQRGAVQDAVIQTSVFPSLAPDTIVLFVDYSCGYCAVLYQDMVREDAPYAVVIRHATEGRGSVGAQAAIAAECSRLQGRFHPFSYALFGKRDSIGLVAWEKFGAAAGVPDPSAFLRCIDQRETMAIVDQDRLLVERLGLTGTPAALHGGRLYLGPVAIGELARSRPSQRR